MKRTLYRYFPLSSEEQLRRFLLVMEGHIYFASPVSFNDPFEVSNVLPVPTKIEFERALHSTVSDAGNLTKSAKERLYRSIASKVVSESPPLVTIDWLSQIGILFLTESNDDLLMWSHYASNHTGVCIGLDSDKEPFDSAQTVEYTADRLLTTANVAALSDEELVRQILFRKSRQWAYEREWRVVKRPVREEEKIFYKKLVIDEPEMLDQVAQVLSNEGGPGLYEFLSSAIRRIYLGALIDTCVREKILDAVVRLGLNARIFQFVLDRRYFALVPQRVR